MRWVALISCVFLLLLLCYGAISYNNPDSIYYYNSFDDVCEDLDNQAIGRQSHSVGNIIVKYGEQIEIILMDNIVIEQQFCLKNMILDLNGYNITANNCLKTINNAIIKNGTINMSQNDNAIFVNKNSTCHLNNLTINAYGNDDIFAVNVFGQLFVENSEINSCITNGSASSNSAAIYGNIFSFITIKNSNLFASTDFGISEGVHAESCEIYNSRIVAYANYDSNQKGFTNCSIGCNIGEYLTIKDSYVYGVHSGINTHGTLIVDGGIYEGYGHGGIYMAGCGKEAYIQNATIAKSNMPDGYKSFKELNTHTAMYIGGGNNVNNIKVYIDNSNIIGEKYSIALRGTDHENNNELYISNSTVNSKIRIDNNTHHVFVGTGCENIDTTMNEQVVETNEIYNIKEKRHN